MGSRPRPTTRRRPIEAGELHFDLYGEKLKGRFVLDPPGPARARGKEQWLLLHKHDEHAVPGWDPEDHPRVGAQRPHERRGRRRPGRRSGTATCRPRRPRSGSGAVPWRRHRPTTSWPPSTRAAAGNGATWTVCRAATLEAHQPRQGAVPRARRRGARSPSATSSATTPASRPLHAARTSPSGRSTCTGSPNGVDQAGLLAQGGAGRTRRTGSTRWHYDDARPGETEWYFVVDSAPALAWLANYAAVELHPWTSAVARRPPADVGAHRHRPRDQDRPSTTSLRARPAATAPRSSTSASSAGPR